MYVAKYRDNKPFIEFYNVVAPTGYGFKQRIKRISQQDRTPKTTFIRIA